MSSTTVTEFYGLTQYVGTDKPSFTDNNEAYRAMDGDLHEAVVGVRDQAESISAIRATVASLNDAVVTLQGDLDTEKGKIVNLQNKETLQDTEIATVKANARNMITAYNEETAESTHAYSVGDYFTYNNVLYKATDTIAIGDTIVPDTNCTTDNVTTELMALASDLSGVESDLSGVETDLTPLTYSTIGAEIIIESGYTALADGYFTIANAGATGDFTLTLNSTDVFKYYFDGTNKPYEKFAIFVKKGMTISWTTGMAGGAYYIRYNPLVASS